MEQVIDIDINKLDRICRCCLTEIPKINVIIDNLSQLLNILFSLEEKQDLPEIICKPCADEIFRICEFRKKVFQSDEILTTIISQTAKSDVEDVVNIPFDNDDTETFQIEVSEQEEGEEFEKEALDDDIKIEEPQLEEALSPSVKSESSELIKTEPVVPKKRPVKSKVYNCSCGKVINGRKAYIEHLRQVKHPKKPRRRYPCIYCGKMFDKFRMTGHITKHTKEKPFICEICGAALTSDANLRRHKNRHSEQRFMCGICGKAFVQPYNLKLHLKTHSNTDPFFCSMCGIGFKDKESSMEHRRMKHKTYSLAECRCKICDKVYSSQSTLKAHMLRHGEKTVYCTVCNKGFYNKGALSVHSRIHSGERPYSCKYCEKSFKFMITLQNHELIHTGERPHSCKICSKTFTQLGHLNSHMVVHTEERAHSCSYCGNRYRQMSSLRVHIRTHTGETPYKCDQCERGFHDSSAMKKHRKTHFKNTGSSVGSVKSGKEVSQDHK